MVDIRVTGGLLRRHVGRCADRRAGLGQRVALRSVRATRDGLRDAEVRHRGAAAREQHVVGLDVAVHDAVAVRIRERARDVAQDADRLVERHRAAQHPMAQRLTATYGIENHGRPPASPEARTAPCADAAAWRPSALRA